VALALGLLVHLESKANGAGALTVEKRVRNGLAAHALANHGAS
jgi:hypothetical protein